MIIKNHQKVGKEINRLKNMKNYLIKVSAHLPYPIEKEYREEASNIGTSVNRAIKKYRKEANGKRIKELTIKAIRL